MIIPYVISRREMRSCATTLEFIGNPNEWKKEVLGLRNMCAGEAGDVSEYEMEHI